MGIKFSNTSEDAKARLAELKREKAAQAGERVEVYRTGDVRHDGVNRTWKDDRKDAEVDLDAELATWEENKRKAHPLVIIDEASVVTEAAWSAAARTVRMKGKRKPLITLRLEADLLEWFRATGPGYQARMAEALEEYRRRAT